MKRQNMVRYGTLALTLSLLLCSATLATAQTTSNTDVIKAADAPLSGVIRIKVVPEHTSKADLDRLVAKVTGQIGSVDLSPWMNRDLLFASFADEFFTAISRGEFSAGELPLFSIARIMTLTFDPGLDPSKVALTLESLPEIEYAEPVYPVYAAFVPNDPAIGGGTQWHHQVIETPFAWDFEQGDRSVVIAVVDNGVSLTHEDLAPQIWFNEGEAGDLATNGIDDDNNGLIDDWRGYDFAGEDGVSPDNDPSPGTDAHGTHVAGIAAATGGNGLGGAGVTLDSRVMAVKVAGGKRGDKYVGAYDGLLYAATMGADIINCSWGSSTYSRAEQELVSYVRNDLGAIIIAAAGNSGTESPYYPASYDHTISVGSTRPDDRKASTSNYHHTIDLSAPGEGVWSTVLNNSYGLDNGTSMSTPMVSGAAALLLSRGEELTPEQVEIALIASTSNNDILLGQASGLLGSGRLNVGRALERYKTLKGGRVLEIDVVDENGNGVLDLDERARLVVTVENVLAPASEVAVSVEPAEATNLVLSETSWRFGAMESGERGVSGEGSLLIEVPENLPPDTKTRLWITLTVDNYKERRLLELDIFPTWATTDLNDIASTFNGVGKVGYDGLTTAKNGDGFYFDGEGSLLWHGGLLLGWSEESLADVVRRGTVGSGTNEGFRMIDPYRVERPNETREIGSARFRMKEAPDVVVAMTTYEYAADPSTLLVTYDIENRSAEKIEAMYCGLYLDWDLRTDGARDQALLDRSLRLGIMRNSDVTDLFTGVALLSDQDLNYVAVDNRADGIQVDFPVAKKWEWLSGGILRESTPVDIDASMMLGAGPFDIEVDSVERVAFALVAARDLPGLQEAVTQGESRLKEISSVAVAGSVSAAPGLVTPQPVSSFATITFDEPLSQDAEFMMFDAAGRSVAGVEFMRTGVDGVRIDARRLPVGIYSVRLVNGETTKEVRLVIAR